MPKKVRWELDETLREKAQAARESTPPPPAPCTPRATPRAPKKRGLSTRSTASRNFVVGPRQSARARRKRRVRLRSGQSVQSHCSSMVVSAWARPTWCNAIGHAIMQRNPRSRILYVSAEQFTNEFIWSLQNHQINTFPGALSDTSATSC